MAESQLKQELEDFFTQKALWIYRHFLDTDGNGVLSQEDFDSSAIKYAVLHCRGDKVLSIWARYERLFSVIWEEMKKDADVNKDDRVDFDEWKDFLIKSAHHCSSFSELPHFLQELVHLQFGVFDVNDDGFIEEDEYRLYLCARNMDMSQAKKCFDTMSTDKRGINKVQFDALFFDYLTSTDAVSPGRYIMGPWDSANSEVMERYMKSAKAWEWKRQQLDLHLY